MRLLVALAGPSLVALLVCSCAGGNSAARPDCPVGQTSLDGTCVSQQIADYVGCIRATGATVASDSAKSLSAAAGVAGVTGSTQAEVKDKLEKSYAKVSDENAQTIIRNCDNKTAGLAAITGAGAPGRSVAGGLVGMWSFGEGIGSSSTDGSGVASAASFVGSPQWASDAPSGRRGSLQFDGVHDYATVKRTASLEPSGAITVALWGYFTDSRTAGFADIVRKADAYAPGYLLRWSHRDGKLHFFVDRAGAANNLRIDDVADSQSNAAYLNMWHHYAATYDVVAGVARLFVDGVQRATITNVSGALEHTGDLYFMSAPYPYQTPVPGRIADVRIYARALGPDEVASLAGRR